MSTERDVLVERLLNMRDSFDRRSWNIYADVCRDAIAYITAPAEAPVARIHQDGYWTHPAGKDPLDRYSGKTYLDVYASARQQPEKTCNNCKHRGKEIAPRDSFAEFRKRKVTKLHFVCTRAVHINGPNVSEFKHEEETKILNEESFYLEDGEGYHAALCVADDFGCNRWEAKP